MPVSPHDKPLSKYWPQVLVSGMILVVAMLGVEVAHYLRATDYGMTDNLVTAMLFIHPQCKEKPGNPFELTCPLPGYGSVRLQCWSIGCSYRDPNAPDLTPEIRGERKRNERADRLASRRVEPPLALLKKQKSIRARYVEANGGSYTPTPSVIDDLSGGEGHEYYDGDFHLNRRVETLQDAAIIVIQRQLQESRKIAEDQMRAHGR